MSNMSRLTAPRVVKRPDCNTLTDEKWHWIVSRYSEGETLLQICRDYDWSPDSLAMLQKWCGAPERAREWLSAEKAHAHASVEIAHIVAEDPEGVMLDTTRAKLVVQNRRQTAAQLDPDRFGPKLQVQHEHKVSLRMALEAAENRLALPQRDPTPPKALDVIDITPVSATRSTDTQSAAFRPVPPPPVQLATPEPMVFDPADPLGLLD